MVRAAYQLRADYLRSTAAPEDTASLKQAAALDAAARSLTRDRAAVQLTWASATVSKLNQKYPDAAARPERVLDVWTGSTRGADGSPALTVSWRSRTGRPLDPDAFLTHLKRRYLDG